MSSGDIAKLSPRIYSTQWFSMPALALETPSLRLITVPEIGAKIVSIYDRIAGHEWLLPPKNGILQPVDYGASFVEQDMSGWDEMFPTIDPCAYPVEGAYFGLALPDHGEVWSLAWTHDESIRDGIHLSVEGRTLPFVLSRTIRIADERTLRISYEVVNTGAETLSALWAAHPQFAADESTRIILPADVTEVVSVQTTEEFPAVGQRCDWNVSETQAGEQLHLDRVRSASAHQHRKVYLPPDKPVKWAGLQHNNDGSWLRLSWDANVIPYLGIWVDEGSINPRPTTALEPSTGYYDSLARACQNKRVMTLPPGELHRWSLEIELGNGQIRL